MRTFRYKDGTIQRIKILGISDLDFKISWILVSSEPAVSYIGVVSHVQCY